MSYRPQQPEGLERLDCVGEWLSDQSRHTPCPAAGRKKSVRTPRIEVKDDGRAGAALDSRAPGLVADHRADLDWLINLDSEAGVANYVVRRDHIQSHDLRNNRLACERGAADDQAKGPGDRDNGGDP